MLYRVYPRIIPQPKRLYWQISVPLSARRSHVVLTISENSRQDIMKYLGTAADKIVVSHLAVDDRLAKARLAQEGHQAPGKLARKPLPAEPYVFTLINSIKGHKNLLGLITAFRICHAKLPGFKLVVGGGAGIEAETRRIVECHGLTEAVLLTDYLSLEEMAWLYAHASAYIIPSLFEGFGLPALEAMSFGVPVTCSHAGSLPEVVSDAGLFFDPKDSAEMANCLGRILTDDALRADLIQKGRRRVSEFSWQETARKTLSAYELALDRKNLGVR
jgi:glycosyltransferase involved in cell wall biosynthesis